MPSERNWPCIPTDAATAAAIDLQNFDKTCLFQYQYNNLRACGSQCSLHFKGTRVGLDSELSKFLPSHTSYSILILVRLCIFDRIFPATISWLCLRSQGLLTWDSPVAVNYPVYTLWGMGPAGSCHILGV